MSLTAAEIEQDYNLYSKDLNVRGAHGVPGYTLLRSCPPTLQPFRQCRNRIHTEVESIEAQEPVSIAL
jgi:hypothetical protein